METVNLRDELALFLGHWSPFDCCKEIMLSLYHDRHYTFRFAGNRLIPRFHLEGVGAGRRVDVFRLDPATGERLGLLTTGTAGDGGWVDVREPIIVRAGDAFVAVVTEESDA